MERKEQIAEYEGGIGSASEKISLIHSLLRFICPWLALFAIALVIFLVAGFMHKNAENIGKGVAELPGKATGIAVGSYKGFTEGVALGSEAGKEAGLGAEDTKAEIEDEIRSVGNLEVLVAGVRIGNFHEYADKYSALYIYKADAVFSVDLSRAEVYHDGSNSIIIYLPKPQVKLYINEGAEKLAEWQKNLYTGDAKDGYIAYLNSMKNVEKISLKEIANYEMLIEQAKEAAVRQIRLLAKAVCEEGTNIRVICGNEEAQ